MEKCPVCQGSLAQDNPAGLECESCHRIWIYNGEGWETVAQQVFMDSSNISEGSRYSDAVKVVKQNNNMSEEKSTQDVAQAPVPSITNFRLRLDMFINSIPFIHSSREVSLAHTHLQRAFMWLGKAQSAAGSESPYKESFNHKTPAIEPTADHSQSSLMDALWDLPEYGTHTARVKSLRTLISSHLRELKSYYPTDRTLSLKSAQDFVMYITESRLAAEEASMWLGWELARIKKEQENPPSTSQYTSVGLPL